MPLQYVTVNWGFFIGLELLQISTFPICYRFQRRNWKKQLPESVTKKLTSNFNFWHWQFGLKLFHKEDGTEKWPPWPRAEFGMLLWFWKCYFTKKHNFSIKMRPLSNTGHGKRGLEAIISFIPRCKIYSWYMRKTWGNFVL